jgi:hypothetical protein
MLNMRQKQALTQTIKKRYRTSTKVDKSRILNELIATTGYNRSYARRLFNNLQKTGRKKKRRARARLYDQLVLVALKTIWMAADNICSKRLKPFLPELLEILEKNGEIVVDDKTRQKLIRLSCATIDRLLLSTRRRYQLKGRSTTKPGTLLRSAIPVRTYADWNESKPGFFEADLVALCGNSVAGGYINILDLTDVFTSWICLEAMMGKGQFGVHGSIDAIRRRLPFSLLGIDSDNGTEFVNEIINRYCQKHLITFTRIRPYRKNDNCFVEQKNFSVVRRFLGYTRRETEEELIVVREILKLIEIYVNFFQPSLKLIAKVRVDNRTKKTYDTAKTPFQRLLNSGILGSETKQKLFDFYYSQNPMALRRKIGQLNQKLDQLHRYNLIESTNT